jgi:hypothetical protein
MRTGGLDQIPASRAGTPTESGATESGVTQRTLVSPALAAFAAHSASARSLTSTAQTVAPGARAASTHAIGP